MVTDERLRRSALEPPEGNFDLDFRLLDTDVFTSSERKACDAVAMDSTGNDEIEGGEVVVAIQGDPVKADPFTDFDADRSDFLDE